MNLEIGLLLVRKLVHTQADGKYPRVFLYRFMMDNFETEMVVMASDCNATIQAGNHGRCQRFQEYFMIRTIVLMLNMKVITSK